MLHSKTQGMLEAGVMIVMHGFKCSKNKPGFPNQTRMNIDEPDYVYIYIIYIFRRVYQQNLVGPPKHVLELGGQSNPANWSGCEALLESRAGAAASRNLLSAFHRSLVHLVGVRGW